jgi:hypothetical protein
MNDRMNGASRREVLAGGLGAIAAANVLPALSVAAVNSETAIQSRTKLP